MAGVSGRSGRKAKYEEWGVNELVQSSIKIVRQFLEDEEQPLDKKADVACRFALKMMPDKVEHNHQLVLLKESTLQRISSLLTPKALDVEYKVIEETPSTSDAKKSSDIISKTADDSAESGRK
jgi:hypothetical protein